MRPDDSRAQLTRCSGQTEATSGRTIEQSSTIEVRTGRGDQTEKVVPSPAPQQVEVSAKAADDGMANPKVTEEAEEDVVVEEEAQEDALVEEEAEEDTRTDLQQDEPPRDGPLPDLPTLGRGDDPYTFNFSEADLAKDIAQDKKDLIWLQ